VNQSQRGYPEGWEGMTPDQKRQWRFAKFASGEGIRFINAAKQILGSRCCIQGNIPSSMMVTGSASEVKALCKKLIENCGKGGGYILGAGAIAENPKLENLQAMGAAAREFGVYKK